jgi:hypothetical protein
MSAIIVIKILLGLRVQSVAKGFIQILTGDISEVCRGAIVLEAYCKMDFQKGTTSSSSSKVS